MPRGRKISRGMSDDPNLNSLCVEARLLFNYLIVFADREGRLFGEPRWVNRTLFPMDDFTDRQVGEWLKSLAGKGLIELYEVDGHKYMWLPRFESEQGKCWTRFSKEKEAESGIPPPLRKGES